MPADFVHAGSGLHALVAHRRQRRHQLCLRRHIQRHLPAHLQRDHSIGQPLGSGKDVVGQENRVAGDDVRHAGDLLALRHRAARLAVRDGGFDEDRLVLQARLRPHPQGAAGRPIDELGCAQDEATAGDAASGLDGESLCIARHRHLLGPDVAPLHDDPERGGPMVVGRRLGACGGAWEQHGGKHGEPRTMAKDCTHLLRISAQSCQ